MSDDNTPTPETPTPETPAVVPAPTPPANAPKRGRFLVHGLVARDEDFQPNETIKEFLDRIEEEGLPQDRFQAFYVDGVPADLDTPLQPGARLTIPIKTAGGC